MGFWDNQWDNLNWLSVIKRWKIPVAMNSVDFSSWAHQVIGDRSVQKSGLLTNQSTKDECKDSQKLCVLVIFP
jgi:hypothetical protein